MLASFTDIEKNLLYGQSRPIAEKNNCSQKYVKMILENERSINTNLAKKIYNDLKTLVEFLKPKDTADV